MIKPHGRRLFKERRIAAAQQQICCNDGTSLTQLSQAGESSDLVRQQNGSTVSLAGAFIYVQDSHEANKLAALRMEDAILSASAGLFETLPGAEDAIISTQTVLMCASCKAKRYRYASNDMQGLKRLKKREAVRIAMITPPIVYSR